MRALLRKPSRRVLQDNLGILRESARRAVVAREDVLSLVEDDKHHLTREVQSAAESLQLTERDMVVLMY